MFLSGHSCRVTISEGEDDLVQQFKVTVKGTQTLKQLSGTISPVTIFNLGLVGIWHLVQGWVKGNTGNNTQYLVKTALFHQECSVHNTICLASSNSPKEPLRPFPSPRITRGMA